MNQRYAGKVQRRKGEKEKRSIGLSRVRDESLERLKVRTFNVSVHPRQAILSHSNVLTCNVLAFQRSPLPLFPFSALQSIARQFAAGDCS